MKTRHNLLGGSLLGSLLLAAPAPAASRTCTPFGRLADGRAVTSYTLPARSGVHVRFISYSGIIRCDGPDRPGRPAHLVLGFATLREYETKNAQGELYFGALLGRYANWLKRGRFSLDGRSNQLTLSDPPNTIHGGERGFD